MGVYGCDDDGSGGIPSQDCKTYCGDGGKEGRWRGMGVDLGGHGAGSIRGFSDKGVCAEAAGNNG